MIETNLTKSGCLFLIVSLVLLCGVWYLLRIVIGWEFNTYRYFVGGGVAFIGGGMWVLNRMGIDIIK